jgi:hypothetical protein
VARILDAAFFLPVVAGLITVAILLVSPHYGPLFPDDAPCPATPSAGNCTSTNQVPGFVWLELTIISAGIAASAVYVIADATITSRWHRTPGKAIMGIRPVHLPDSWRSWSTTTNLFDRGAHQHPPASRSWG